MSLGRGDEHPACCRDLSEDLQGGYIRGHAILGKSRNPKARGVVLGAQDKGAVNTQRLVGRGTWGEGGTWEEGKCRRLLRSRLWE